MARGQQKIQAQQKNAEKAAKIKKHQQAGDSKTNAQAALKWSCKVCMVRVIDSLIRKEYVVT